MNHAAHFNQVVARPTYIIGSATLLAAFISTHAPAQNIPVQVVVDMDTHAPGIQSIVQVRQCETVARDIAVYIFDPLGTRAFYSVGYIGGIDRGIAFGHVPDNGNQGAVASITHTNGTPANPGNSIWITPGFIPMFTGAEINYVEVGASEPAIIAAQPTAPIFTVDVALANAQVGDEFRFYLVDHTRVWAGEGHGAFSTTEPVNSLDTGGDAVPDQTITVAGVDPDSPAPSPSAAFLVDYIDGPVSGGGAIIQIIPKLGDINADAIVNVVDLLAVINAWGPCAPEPGGCPADLNDDQSVNVGDLLIVINNWGGCN